MERALLGEFGSADACARAITALRGRGWTQLDAYMPYPAKNIEEALGLSRSPLPRVVLATGLVGAAVGYFILWWTQNVDYPLDVGGHPTNAIPAYIGITFETAVLFAAFGAFIGSLRFCKLPRLWHPVFEVRGFERASIDRFFVVAFGEPEKEASLREDLSTAGALRIASVNLGKDGA